jgi:hypothetical protein
MLRHAEIIMAPNLAATDLTARMYSLVDYNNATALTPANIIDRELEKFAPFTFVLVCSYLLRLRNSEGAIAEGTIGVSLLVDALQLLECLIVVVALPHLWLRQVLVSPRSPEETVIRLAVILLQTLIILLLPFLDLGSVVFRVDQRVRVIDVVEGIPGSADDAVAVDDGRTILGKTVLDEHGILAAIHMYLERDPETRFPLEVLLTTDNLTHAALKPLEPVRARELLSRIGALDVREVKLASLVEEPLGIDLRGGQWRVASKIHHNGRLLGVE